MLITILIIAIVAVLAFYIVDKMGLEQPIKMVVSIIVGLVLLIALLSSIGIKLPIV